MSLRYFHSIIYRLALTSFSFRWRFRAGLAVFFWGIALIAEAQILPDYLKEAAQNNPGLKVAYSEYESAMQRVAQAKGLPDPAFKASAFGQMVETRVGQQMAQFSVDQMFPWFGTLKAKGDVAALEAEAALENFYDTRNELFYKVKAAYYPLYELDETVKLQEENLEILNTYKTLATSRFQNSRGPMADVIRVNIMIDDMTTEINILKTKRKALVTTFNKLLNRGDDEEVIVADTLTIPAAASVPKDSLINNPKLASLEKMAAASETRRTVARKEGMPMLGLGFNYIVINKRTDMDVPDNGKDAYMPMFTITLPIYRKKYKAMAKEAELMKTSYDEMKNNMANELISMYEMSRFEMDQSRQLADLYNKQIQQTKQATDLITTAVSNSNEDFEDILEMQQKVLMYKVKQIQAIVSYKTSEAKLQYLTNDQ